MSTETELEAAALTAASTITVGDITALVQWVVKLVGGHDNAAALIEADREAVRVALDVAEEMRLQKETAP